MKKQPLLSIVVTSYSMRRFKDLCNLFDSIREQTYQNIEIIFVADNSKKLAKKVEDYLKKHNFSRFKVILNEGKIGVNVCRNIGIMNSNGEIIGIVDDDVMLFPDWAEEMVKSYLKNDSVVGVTGPAIPLWEEPEKMSWFPKEFYFIWGCTVWDWNDEREIRNVGGMNCSYNKEALLKTGLYNPLLGPKGGGARLGKWNYVGAEEIDLSLRLKKVSGGKIIYNPKIQVYHKVRRQDFNLANVIKRCLHFGYTKGYVRKNFRDLDESILKMEREHLKYIFTYSYLKLWKEFFKNPITTLKKFTILPVGVVFTVLGYFIYFLKSHSG